MAGVAHAGQHHETRDDAVFYGCDHVGVTHAGLYARIHVRLKPEGAPRRYASEDERWWWEHEPRIARILDNGGRVFAADFERVGRT